MVALEYMELLKNVAFLKTVCYNQNIQLIKLIHISFSELQSSKIPDNDTIEYRTDTGRSFFQRKRNRGRIRKREVSPFVSAPLKFWNNRVIFYLSKMYTEQIKEGRNIPIFWKSM